MALAPDGLEPRIPFAIGGRPSAVRLPRRELPGIPIVVEAFDEAINPAETQCLIEGIVVGDGWKPRLTLVEYEPHLRFRVEVLGEPLSPLFAGPHFKGLQTLGKHLAPST